MKLIITRHGETEENKQGILQGQMHGKLSNLGIEQAKKLAKKLSGEKLNIIYSSDLARASDTAKEIVKFHPNINLVLAKELREKDQGSYTGKKQTEVDWKNKPLDIESKESMQIRAKKIFDLAYENFPEGVVLFVGHGNINKRIFELIYKHMNLDLEKTPEFSNASISVIEITKIEEKYLCNILEINSIHHL
jgi:probable phosphoglycerate mutase